MRPWRSCRSWGSLKCLTATLLAMGLFSSTAGAFDVFPEFHALTESEASSFNDTRRIDSEYTSDVVTYLEPLAWEAAFHSSNRAFQFTLGSLSNKNFLHNGRLKLNASLTESLEFRLTAFQQRDLEVDQTHTIMELVQRLGGGFSVSAYGEPSLFKRENDFGLALLYSPRAGHEIRVFHTWVDLTRQEHNDRPDTFAKGYEASSLGVVGRCTGCLGFSREEGTTESSASRVSSQATTHVDWIEWFVRREAPVQWRFPQSDREYRFDQWALGTKARLPLAQRNSFVNARLQYSEKREANVVVSSQAETNLNRRLLESLVSMEWPVEPLGARSTIEPGVGWFHRNWSAEGGRRLEHRNFVPFVWLKTDLVDRGTRGFDRLDLGYELTAFKGDDDVQLAAEGLIQNASEHRMNFRYAFALEKSAELTIALTADLDVLAGGTGGLFEGGNGQFRVFF